MQISRLNIIKGSILINWELVEKRFLFEKDDRFTHKSDNHTFVTRYSF